QQHHFDFSFLHPPSMAMKIISASIKTSALLKIHSNAACAIFAPQPHPSPFRQKHTTTFQEPPVIKGKAWQSPAFFQTNVMQKSNQAKWVFFKNKKDKSIPCVRSYACTPASRKG
ncbi:hypothetical protein, partial [Chromobacterium haemolyticum]|uniref:hypothetical protein n=1 Tax=Chromobacterium haemolyticum TaxID=394935 RepID=UPI0012FC79FB